MALPRDIAALVPMTLLLQELHIEVNERTHRCRCIVLGGSNPSSFSWSEHGVWYCHACGAGGDRIGLVRAVRGCSFREAVEFLSEIAGVAHVPHQLSRQEIERAKAHRERVESAAWKIRDEVSRLRQYYRDTLHRCDRLWCCFGDDLVCARDDVERDFVWARMERLAAVATFFLAAYNFFCTSNASGLTRLAVSTPAQRRMLIFGDKSDEYQGRSVNGAVSANGLVPSGTRN